MSGLLLVLALLVTFVHADGSNETVVDRVAVKEMSEYELAISLAGQSGGENQNSAPTSERSVVQVSKPSDCECVPYYQCSANQTLFEHGEGLIDIRIGNGPCEDYLKVCCPTSALRDPNNPITPAPTSKPPRRCGQRNANGVSTLRITGDEDNEAQFGEFPWMVAILTREPTEGLTGNIYKCGGSIIHPKVVLTAAHCVRRAKNLLVRAGEWDTQRMTEPLPTQNVRVKDVITHEQYYAGGLLNDVALLILESPFEPADHISPVCLPLQGVASDSLACLASGWGKNVFGKGEYQVILKKVELPIVPRERCLDELQKTKLGKEFKLHSSFICAGGVPGKDTCKGDGGGPLVCPKRDEPDSYEQAGIVAWGIGCGSVVPGVYVSVAQFRNWIDKNLLAYGIHLE